MVVMVLMVEMMMMMMIMMKSSSMTVTMATISLLRQISLSRRAFSLSIVFRLAAVAEYFSGRSPRLRVLGRLKYAKGHGRGGPGRPHHAQARPRAGPILGVVWFPCGPPPALLLASSVF